MNIQTIERLQEQNRRQAKALEQFTQKVLDLQAMNNAKAARIAELEKALVEYTKWSNREIIEAVQKLVTK